MKASRGFTLVESMVAIAIVAILMAVGVPSYKYVTTANRISSEVNGLLGDLQYARSQAVKQGQSATVCVSNDGATCTGGSAWNNGWIVFTDPNSNATVDVAANEFVLRIQKPFTSTDTFSAAGNVTAVTFNREGIAIGIAAGTQLRLQNAAPVNNAWTRCLTVTSVGLAWTQMYNTTVNNVAC